MKVTIVTGGSGSEALQKGLWDLYGDNLEISHIINFYDNGKSTGAVRKVYNGKIGGPSDIRKNQILRAKLEGKSGELVSFLEERFTKRDAKEYVLEKLNRLDVSKSKKSILGGAIKHYFSQPLSGQILYEDFAIGNIVYSGLAGMNSYSIQKAADIMANILEIKCNTLVSDDKSLFLGAITESGRHIIDEGEIVEWANAEDKIVGITLKDEKGNDFVPVLSDRCKNEIYLSDIIILSSGTQWSSLIPTYQCEGWKEALEGTDAKIYMVMNGAEDKDTFGVDAQGIWDIVSPYLPKDKVTVIQNDAGENILTNPIKHIHVKRNAICNKTGKHIPKALVLEIMKDFWEEHFTCDIWGFDWDNTIKGRKNTYVEASQSNINMLESLKVDTFICSGNTRKEINVKNVPIFAENGVNFYQNGQKYCLNEDLKITNFNKLLHFFLKLGIDYDKISNRNDTILSIKPLSELERKLILFIFDASELKNDYNCYITGTSTIDVMDKKLQKDVILEHSLLKGKKICYLGDEPQGNDKVLFENTKIKTFEVKTPKDTYVFLKTLKNISEESKK